MELKDQHFGIEIEMTGLSRSRAAEVIADYFGSSAAYEGTYYDAYSVQDHEGRKWKVMSDGSIDTQKKDGNRKIFADRTYSVELVSPICRYEDIVPVQEIVRKLREAGAFSNPSCGIHVHVDASPFDAVSLRNITNIMASKEDFIYKALQVDVEREKRFCRKVDSSFLEELNRKKPKDIAAISNIWYHGRDGHHIHYHDSRYHCLNLHSVFSKGTIEFRLFNGTLHAGKIKSYIQLSLAITAQALNQRCASRKKTHSSNEKYTFRTWLLRLGLIGDEFKTARYHLLEHLEGGIAWKDPEQALCQKERLQAAKNEVRAQEQQPVTTQEQPQTEVEEDFGFSMSM